MFKFFLASVPSLILCSTVFSQTVNSSKSVVGHSNDKPSKVVFLNPEKVKTKKLSSEISEGMYKELKRLALELEKHRVDLRLIDNELKRLNIKSEFMGNNRVYSFVRAKELIYMEHKDYFTNLVNQYYESITEILIYMDELCIKASQK